ncbi:MAG: V-type ATP synthase subunit E [Patescibacteria group bacterium]
MPLDAILQKIKTDSEMEIKKINKDGQKQLAEFAKKAKRELISLKRDFEEKLAEKKGKFLENARNEADFRAKNEILEKKQKLINEIYEKATKKIGNNSSEYYSDLMDSLIEELPSKTDGQIYCAEKDKKLISDILRKKSLAREISNEYLNSNDGGFIFKTENMDIDNTLKTVMLQLKEKTVIEIGKILF